MTLTNQLRKDILELSGEPILKPKRNQSRIGMKYKKNKSAVTAASFPTENSPELKIEPEIKVNPQPAVSKPEIQTTSNPFEKFKNEWSKTLEGNTSSSETLPAGNSEEKTTPVVEPIKPPQPAVEITGATVLLLVNQVLPLLSVIGVRVVTRNKKRVSLAAMKLTAEERESLQELADACAAELLGMLKPIHLFAISLGAIYIGKIIANIEDNENYVPKDKKPKKNA